MKVHLIAIGGAAMHNVAIALHLEGAEVTGSDDQIFDPSRSRLDKYGLLPSGEGWDVDRIHKDLDAVILGMHAREDNPELKKAKDLGLKVYSFPEYVYERTKSKTRVVIGGSHGKTSTTAMILHVLNKVGIEADYLVGAQLDGFECMVRFSESAKVAVIEGDEYLSSPIDRRPKFHLYKPNIAVLTGIAWDHINVFPTFENYVEQFSIFIVLIESGGQLFYCELDDELKSLMRSKVDIAAVGYGVHPHKISNGKTELIAEQNHPIKVFGEHNLQNLSAAKHVCTAIGVKEHDFYKAIESFGGAARRLEKVAENEACVIYKDFAHSPSKLKATTSAFKKQFPERELIACMELHTFSSLNADFLGEYDGAMASADRAIVYFNPVTIKHKKLQEISVDDVKKAFGGDNLEVYTDSEMITSLLREIEWKDRNLLLMTSGNFNGINLDEFGKSLLAIND